MDLNLITVISRTNLFSAICPIINSTCERPKKDSDDVLGEPRGLLLGHLRLDLHFHVLLLHPLILHDLTLLPEIAGSFLFLTILDVLVHFLIDFKQSLFELHLLSELLCCGSLRVHLLRPSLVLTLVCVFLEKCTPLHVLLIELVHLTPLLFLQLSCDEMGPGSINFLGVFNACMDPRREMIVVKRAVWLVGVPLVLGSAIA